MAKYKTDQEISFENERIPRQRLAMGPVIKKVVKKQIKKKNYRTGTPGTKAEKLKKLQKGELAPAKPPTIRNRKSPETKAQAAERQREAHKKRMRQRINREQEKNSGGSW